MNDTLRKVIEKVRRLRALSTSSNVHEASAAAAAADRLIQEYRIEEAMLETEDSDVEGPVLLDSWPSRRPAWRRYLIAGLARHYDLAWCYDRLGGAMRALIWGHPSDVALTREMYAFIGSEIDRLAEGERGAARRRSFRLGAVFGALEAMAAMKGERVRGEVAIVLAGRADTALQALRKDCPNARFATTTPKLPDDPHAFQRGLRAGRRIPHEKSRRIGEGDEN